MSDLKVCLSCVSTKRISPKTRESLSNLLKSSDMSAELFVKESTNLMYVKNDLANDMIGDTVHQTIESRFKYIMFVEDGAEFSVEQIARLISYDVDIIAPVSRNKLSPEFLNCGFFGQDGEGNINKVMFFDSFRLTKTIHQVDWVDSPVMLFKPHVFSAIEYPWFEQCSITIQDEYGDLHRKFVNENIGIGRKFAKAKVEMFVDTNMAVVYE